MESMELLDSTLIAGIGLTYLKVYDQRPGPDGVHSGCPHVHGVTEEAYFGIAGEGCLELHDPLDGFRTVPIRKGTFVQFPPDTLHRSVSHDGLEVLAIMGGGGLAERGDARIYFGPAVDDDAGEYDRLRALAGNGLAGALQRRDAAVLAYMDLLALWSSDRERYREELLRFIALHRRTLAALRDPLREVSEEGSLRRAREAVARVDALPQKVPDTAIPFLRREFGEQRLGMCGLLRQV